MHKRIQDPPLDFAIPDTLAISQPGAKQNFGPQIVEKIGQKFRTFDSILDQNENVMVKNSASLQVLI